MPKQEPLPDGVSKRVSGESQHQKSGGHAAKADHYGRGSQPSELRNAEGSDGVEGRGSEDGGAIREDVHRRVPEGPGLENYEAVGGWTFGSGTLSTLPNIVPIL